MLGFLSFEFFQEIFSTTSLACLLLTLLLASVYCFNWLKGLERWDKYGVKHVDIGIIDVTQMAEVAMREGLDTVGTRRENLILFSRDLELVKEITLKDFTNYVNRPTRLATSSQFIEGIFFLRDDNWKKVRKILSPSFSTSKLRGMSDVFQRCAVLLSKSIEDHARKGKLVNMYHTNGQFTSSVVARTGFALNTEDNIGSSTDDKFTTAAKNILKSFVDRGSLQNFVIFLLQRFPKFHRFLAKELKIGYVDECNMDNARYLDEILDQAIAEREQLQQQGVVYRDFLDDLVAAKRGQNVRAMTGNPGNAKTTGSETDSNDSERTLTQDEVKAHSLTLFFAGFEMTTSALNYCLYFLASHPEVQEKVYNEICEVVQSEQPTYEELDNLRYMKMVINETMRLIPPVAVVVREALENRTYGDMTIPGGAGIYFTLFAIHHDPKHFPEPEKFDPERFNEEETAKRDPLAFAPFGWGPRICIGARLFMIQIKTALVHLLRKVSYEVNEKTIPKKGEKMEIFYTVQLSRPVQPITLQVNLRS